MCEDDRHDKLFRNSETIQRRAWIDLAIARVREHLGSDPVAGNPAADVADPQARQPGTRELREKRPRLVLVRNDGSG